MDRTCSIPSAELDRQPTRQTAFSSRVYAKYLRMSILASEFGTK